MITEYYEIDQTFQGFEYEEMENLNFYTAARIKNFPMRKMCAIPNKGLCKFSNIFVIYNTGWLKLMSILQIVITI